MICNYCESKLYIEDKGCTNMRCEAFRLWKPFRGYVE